MNINNTLFDAIDSYGFFYSCYAYDVEVFLKQELEFRKRQEAAEKIIENVLKNHGKEELIGCLAELARIETGIRELEPHSRDHVVHALLTFMLGIYINEAYLRDNNNSVAGNFQWKLAGLLHDVGYPIEISTRIMRPFENTVNKLRRKFNANQPIQFRLLPDRLNSLSNNIDGLDLIQNQLDIWGLQIDAQKEYSSMRENSTICHGMISSLAVLSIIDAMYQKYNPGREYKMVIATNSNLDWNQEYFEKDITPACTAIFIHNLDHKCFQNFKISPKKAPLPFLLILADTLQEWDRPSHINPQGFSSNLFDIQVENDGLHFYADIPEVYKEGMRDTINNILDVTDIHIE